MPLGSSSPSFNPQNQNWGTSSPLLAVYDDSGAELSASGTGFLYAITNASALFQISAALAVNFLGFVTAPADGALSATSCSLWLDATPGATKLMIKAKDSNGTVRTGSVNLV
jgi:hypothetical protein